MTRPRPKRKQVANPAKLDFNRDTIPVPFPPFPSTPAPNEPTILARLSQLQCYTDQAENHLSNFCSAVFGEGESRAPATNPTTTVEGILDVLGTRLACLCGTLATINQKMGCQPSNT